MVRLKIMLLLGLFVSCWGCLPRGNEVAGAPGIADSLLVVANDKSKSDVERIAAAKAANKLAADNADMAGLISGNKVMAHIYLKRDSPLLAKMYYRRITELPAAKIGAEDLGMAFNNLGVICNEVSEFDSALFYYGRAVDIFGRGAQQLHVAQTMVNIGIVYKIQGSFEDASSVTLAAAKIFDSLGAVNELAAVYSTLGNIQKDLHRAEDALFYLEKSLKMRIEVNDSNGIAGALNNIGNVYRGQRRFEQALDYYLRALAIKEKTGSLKSVGTTLTNMAECYIGLNDPNRAEIYLTRSLAMKEMAQDREGQISALNKLAKLYLSAGNLGKAKLLAERADSLLAGAGYLRQRSEHNLVLAGLAAKSGQFEKALSLTNRGIHLRDSLFDTEMADVVTKYNVRFKTAEKERALLLSMQMQQEQAYRLKTQSYLIVLLIFIVMLFSVVMYLLYRAAAYRKRAKQRVDLLMSELNHRVKNNLQILSGMLNMQMGTTTDDGQIALLEALDSRVASMGNLHALLYQEEYDGIIQIKGFFQSLLENLEQAYGGSRPKFILSLEISEVGLHAKQAIPVGLIVNELLTNIYKYSKMPVNPVLRILLCEIDGKCKLEISDNCGYWDKDKAISKGGLGLVLVDTLVTQLDAVYELRIDENGTTHLMEFKKE